MELHPRAAAMTLFLAALALGAGGCLLADPRPSPWQGGPTAERDMADDLDIFAGVPAANNDGAIEPGESFGLMGLGLSGGDIEPSPIALVATPGTLSGSGGVEVENLTVGGRTLTFAHPAGSFSLEVEAAAGDFLAIRHLTDDGSGEIAAELAEVRVVANAVLTTPGDILIDQITITPPNEDGEITVLGAPGAAPLLSAVSIGDLGSAAGARVQAGVDGSFSAVLVGGSNDRLVIFASDPLDPTSASKSVELLVP